MRRALWACSAIAFALAACGGDEAGTGAQALGGSQAPSPSPTAVGTAMLQWTAPTDSRVQGYRVYYGTVSGTYLQAKGSGANAGASVSYVVPNLEVGRSYYFAVTAYDALGNESEYSSEASKLIQ